MKTDTVSFNLTDLIIDAYERGRITERKECARELEQATYTIQEQHRERNELVRRINELTTDQWETIKAVFDKVYPNNGLSKEDIHDRFHQI